MARRPNGQLAVLRSSRPGSWVREVQRTADQRTLRAAGLPVPEPDDPIRGPAGETILVEAFLAGAPVERLTHALVDDILSCSERQADLAPGNRDWPAWLRQSLTVGFPGWCRPWVLAGDPRCAGLARRCLDVAAACEAAPPGTDLIHGDLHQGNLLQVEGRLSGIIDCGAVRAGDRFLDLVVLATVGLAADTEPGVLDRLRMVITEGVDERVRAVYQAHLTVRLLDWALTYQPAEVDPWVERLTREMDS